MCIRDRDISAYNQLDDVLRVLNSALVQMGEKEKVMEAWEMCIRDRDAANQYKTNQYKASV